jgi:hypothetical protein
MKRVLISVTMLMVIMSASVLQGAALTNTSNARPAGVNLPVLGTFTDAAGGTGHFVGSLNIAQFTKVGAVINAVGTLTGTLTDSLGNVLGTVNQALSIPVTATSGSCQILHLELGPLDLNLLGLMVHLNQVVLDITAQSGPGNLLGNLLCAVANLLNGNASLNAITQLLNQILGLLG